MLDKYRDQADVYDLSTVGNVEIPSRIFDRNGVEIGRVFTQNRSLVVREAIPDKMVNALISGEDQRFRTHNGVDYWGVLRALYHTKIKGGNQQGGSTITQQLARNAFDLKASARKKGQSVYERKLVEAFLAQRLEKEYDKSEIITFYLNRIPFGSGYYGIRSASLGYFGVEPSALTTEQCASLVGCIKNPSYYSPVSQPKRNKWSRDNVLRRMGEDGFLKDHEVAKYQAIPLTLNPNPLKRGTSHLYGRVLEEVRNRRGEEFLLAGGYSIYTTIDTTLQETAERLLNEQLKRVEARVGYPHPKYVEYSKSAQSDPSYLRGASLVLDNATGEVLAYVGGRNYVYSQYDFIRSARRPLGTAFFPFVYAAAFENGLSPVTPVLDDAMDNRTLMIGGTEGIVAEYGQESLSPTYEMNITARRALATSKIAASVRLGNETGLGTVAKTAQQFGLNVDTEKLLPRMLVGWDQASISEVTRAYGTIANLGQLPPEMKILDRIETQSGEVIYRAEASQGSARVMEKDAAYQLHSVLTDVAKSGNLAGEVESLGAKAFHGALKTGTTHTFADNWAVGYNSKITCSVWAGFLDSGNKPIYKGGAFAKETVLPMLTGLMRTAQVTHPGIRLDPPKGLEQVQVCAKSGGLATRFCYDEVVDEENGSTRFVSTTYTDFLREKKDSLSYCDLHGQGVTGLSQLLEDFSPDRAPENVRTELVVPIRPQSSPLLGEDPYRSEMPDLVQNPDSYQAPRTSVNSFIPSEISGDERVRLQLKQPKRLQIIVD